MDFGTFLSTIFTQELYYKIIGSIVVISIFGLLYFLNNIVFRSIVSKFSEHFSAPIKIVKTIFGIIIVISGFLSILGSWGVDVKNLITGFGITGFIVTFALRDMLASMLSGIMIITYKPFSIGDRILVGKFEGVVKTIELQSTTIVDKDKEYTLPNTMVSANGIKVVESKKKSSSSK